MMISKTVKIYELVLLDMAVYSIVVELMDGGFCSPEQCSH